MSFEEPVIMIVDDEPQNLRVLEGMLRQDAYKVIAFPRGDLALAAACEAPPDIVLLDIRMPGIDGYEVCRRLKADEGLKDIPVIFLSGLSDPGDKVRAFEAGGVDYVSKPLSEPEVLARVRTHLSIRWHNIRLNELVRQRTAELAAANRRLQVWDAAKTHWLTMLAHELRTPLTGLFCVADILFKSVPPDLDIQGLREDFNWSCARIKKLIDDATLLATIDISEERFELSCVDLMSTLVAAVADSRTRTEEQVEFETEDVGGLKITVHASSVLLRRALSDLLATAGCCVPSGGKVSIRLRQENRSCKIEIKTCGKTLPPDDLLTFFDVGGQRTLIRGGADFGLGPAVALRAVQLFDGDVSVRNNGSDGIIITVSLPTLAK